MPILGVCLGHQCIGAAYGGEIVRAGRPMHGKTSMIHHRGTGIFRGLPTPFRATRYHSLVIAPASVPPELEVIGHSEDGEIMAVQHRSYPVSGCSSIPSRCSPSTATACSTTSCTASPRRRARCRSRPMARSCPPAPRRARCVRSPPVDLVR